MSPQPVNRFARVGEGPGTGRSEVEITQEGASGCRLPPVRTWLGWPISGSISANLIPAWTRGTLAADLWQIAHVAQTATPPASASESTPPSAETTF